MSNNQQIAALLRINLSQVEAVEKLLDDGNTLPFIARYRKEATGGLDDIQLRRIEEALSRFRGLDERRETILKSIRGQGLLTPELTAKINSADSRPDLEDLYQPYKPKRKTRASLAKEQGLEPLADIILSQDISNQSPLQLASAYLSDSLTAAEDVWQGARDIVAEKISEHPPTRQVLRAKALQLCSLQTEKNGNTEDSRGVYQDYYAFEIQVNRIRPHQILAINRAENEDILRVKLTLPEDTWRNVLRINFPQNPASPLADQLEIASEDAAKRLLLPAIFRDVRRKLTDQAEEHALEVFAKNLKALLLQPPLAGHTVLGLDPGFRTGCKVAVVDPTGKPLETGTIYPVPPRNQQEAAKEYLTNLIHQFNISLIAIGNGTASRETELFIAELIRDLGGLNYLIVSETGASVYSASKLAGRELPEMDVSVRGAVSIARRVQDPLAELVKIDPKSLGVGLYQHDVNQVKLNQKLDQVVESVVNQVGVELNTASPALLSFVAGIGPGLAERIVDYRDQSGFFSGREKLLDVPGLGEKTYQQAAGFLRVREGDNPLDTTAIHPESYPAARLILDQAGIEISQEFQTKEKALVKLSQKKSAEDLAVLLRIGVPTLVDIFKQLLQLSRDPREDLPKPLLRSDVMSLEDLVAGMELQGTVQNVVAFGAFVDLGVKQAGLLHRSQIPTGIDLNLGDIIQVTVKQVDQDRGRISLVWAGH